MKCKTFLWKVILITVCMVFTLGCMTTVLAATKVYYPACYKTYAPGGARKISANFVLPKTAGIGDEAKTPDGKENALIYFGVANDDDSLGIIDFGLSQSKSSSGTWKFSINYRCKDKKVAEETLKMLESGTNNPKLTFNDNGSSYQIVGDSGRAITLENGDSVGYLMWVSAENECTMQFTANSQNYTYKFMIPGADDSGKNIRFRRVASFMAYGYTKGTYMNFKWEDLRYYTSKKAMNWKSKGEKYSDNYKIPSQIVVKDSKLPAWEEITFGTK